MKYLILIYSNPESRAIWDTVSPEDKAAGLGVYEQLDKDLVESGEMIVSEPLDDPAKAKRVRVTEGRALTTDGPFAEVKEYLVGFYLVDCSTVERAVEIAGRIPEAELGLIEVRPVTDLAALA
ncbi:MAG: YciI family protein [Actinophytocola sp.]|uniref:YciI family protein n=1 Tax=Actinophytocola sp. TaxID=1872138 RepID=UPI001329B7D9|nr:YciI family protein [Actinophytocola sp.]MPZ85553.1 YciI family protein [Actinophytocola sp.]